MNEALMRRVDLRANLADRLDRQHACQHPLGEADVTLEFRFLHAADVALRASVQLDERQVRF